MTARAGGVLLSSSVGLRIKAALAVAIRLAFRV